MPPFPPMFQQKEAASVTIVEEDLENWMEEFTSNLRQRNIKDADFEYIIGEFRRVSRQVVPRIHTMETSDDESESVVKRPASGTSRGGSEAVESGEVVMESEENGAEASAKESEKDALQLDKINTNSGTNASLSKGSAVEPQPSSSTSVIFGLPKQSSLSPPLFRVVSEAEANASLEWWNLEAEHFDSDEETGPTPEEQLDINAFRDAYRKAVFKVDKLEAEKKKSELEKKTELEKQKKKLAQNKIELVSRAVSSSHIKKRSRVQTSLKASGNAPTPVPAKQIATRRRKSSSNTMRDVRNQSTATRNKRLRKSSKNSEAESDSGSEDEVDRPHISTGKVGDSWIVEKITDYRIKEEGNGVEYFTKWHGWPSKYNSWEPESHFERATIEGFWEIEKRKYDQLNEPFELPTSPDCGKEQSVFSVSYFLDF